MKAKFIGYFIILTLSFSLMSMQSLQPDPPSIEPDDPKESKFWGNDYWSTTVCNEDCCTRTTRRTYYVFWIATNTEVTDVSVTCW